jgi:hypothetical protein
MALAYLDWPATARIADIIWFIFSDPIDFWNGKTCHCHRSERFSAKEKLSSNLKPTFRSF